jgi:prolipoprotein diacylglyceryltransferase
MWAGWYGLQRFLIDFTRNTDLPNADATAGPFTWSQWTGLAVGIASTAIVLWIVARKKTPVVSSVQDAEYGAVVAVS